MKIAIVGSRSATPDDYKMIEDNVPSNCTHIISGGAIGVDTLAQQYAKNNSLLFTKILPNYEKHGKTAPLIRNLEIIDRADLVLCFWDGKSRGTAFVVENCIKKYKPIKVININSGSEIKLQTISSLNT